MAVNSILLPEPDLNIPVFDFLKLHDEEPTNVNEKAQRDESTVQCGAGANSVNNISFEADDDTTILCSYCGKLYKNLTALKRHVQNIHNSLLPFRCNLCGINQQSEKAATFHANMHNKSVNYYCEDGNCDKIFFNKNIMQRHMVKDHGDNVYKCELCENSYKSPASLKAHTESIHGNPTKHPYKCDNDKCNKPYATAEALRTHKTWAHASVEVLYECYKCNKTFDNRLKFKKHAQKHEYDNGYKCANCNIWFRCKKHINAHVCLNNPSADGDISRNDDKLETRVKTDAKMPRTKKRNHTSLQVSDTKNNNDSDKSAGDGSKSRVQRAKPKRRERKIKVQQQNYNTAPPLQAAVATDDGLVANLSNDETTNLMQTISLPEMEQMNAPPALQVANTMTDDDPHLLNDELFNEELLSTLLGTIGQEINNINEVLQLSDTTCNDIPHLYEELVNYVQDNSDGLINLLNAS